MNENIQATPQVKKDLGALCIAGAGVITFIAGAAFEGIAFPIVGLALGIGALIIKVSGNSSGSKPAPENSRPSTPPGQSKAEKSQAAKQAPSQGMSAKDDNKTAA